VCSPLASDNHCQLLFCASVLFTARASADYLPANLHVAPRAQTQRRHAITKLIATRIYPRSARQDPRSNTLQGEPAGLQTPSSSWGHLISAQHARKPPVGNHRLHVSQRIRQGHEHFQQGKSRVIFPALVILMGSILNVTTAPLLLLASASKSHKGHIDYVLTAGKTIGRGPSGTLITLTIHPDLAITESTAP